MSEELSPQADLSSTSLSWSHELLAKIKDVESAETISLENLNYDQLLVLEHMIDRGNADAVLAKIPTIDLDKINNIAIMLLRTLNREGYGQELIAKVASLSITPEISESTYSFLLEMKLWPDNLLEVINKIEPFSVNELTINAKHILLDIIQIGFGPEVLARCKPVDFKKPLTNDALDFIVMLTGIDAFPELSNLSASCRKEIDAAELEPCSGAGPTQNELIDRMPLNLPFKQLAAGWMTAKLSKSGSDCEVFLQKDTDGKIVKLLFKNSALKETSLATYIRAAEVMPGFVSSANYDELSDSPPTVRVRNIGKSFYEVFAGPNLMMLDITKLPPAIIETITLQVIYIRKCLKRYKINHGHPHFHNFNVRFLLQNPETGEKRVEFDADKAVQETIDTKGKITPIVILRDWDQASSG